MAIKVKSELNNLGEELNARLKELGLEVVFDEDTQKKNKPHPDDEKDKKQD